MVKEEKTKKVENLKRMIEKYKVVGIVDMHKMPSAQLQQVRKELGGDAVILVTKKSILKFALDKLEKSEIKKLESAIERQPGIILSNFDAFRLYTILSRLKFSVFAKEGDIAPRDIMVSAGPTTLMPGPAIGEFQRAGVPASIEEGKIVIRRDTTVVKGGDVISGTVSSVLRKLNIKPMEVGLNIVALVDGTDFYTKDILDLVNIFPSKLGEAFSGALNLSVVVVYPTKENIKVLLAKCFNASTVIQNITEVKSTREETKEKSGGAK